MADLGPGTMPRGKYPESPAPAGSHALISRTPTPGGMLHANLGLPRPPPRNFQPPLPRFPSRLSPRRMSGTTVGRILSHPLLRPTHAPATTLKTNGNSAPHKTTKTKSALILACPAAGRGRVAPAARRRRMDAPASAPRSGLNPSTPNPKNKAPRAVTLWRHACLTTPVVKRPLLQPPSEQTATPPSQLNLNLCRSQAPSM